MGDLITPDELPVWVPGETTLDSVPLGWEGVRVRGYRYTLLDVPIPGIEGPGHDLARRFLTKLGLLISGSCEGRRQAGRHRAV